MAPIRIKFILTIWSLFVAASVGSCRTRFRTSSAVVIQPGNLLLISYEKISVICSGILLQSATVN